MINARQMGEAATLQSEWACRLPLLYDKIEQETMTNQEDLV